MERKTIKAQVDIGTPAEPKPVEIDVREPDVRGRRSVAAYQVSYMVNKTGANLDALVQRVLDVLEVPEEQLTALTSWDIVVLGQRLGNWILEGDRPSS